MKELKKNYCLLMVGKTQESAEAGESFKRYIGLGASKVLAVNPTKKQLEEIYGREIQNDPEYTIERDDQKGVVVDIIVQTDPEQCNGIDIISHARFNLFPEKWTTQDGSKVRVIDNYDNAQWATPEEADNHKKLLQADGNPKKIDDNYHICFRGEADLLDFLHKFLYNKNTFSMPNGVWTKMDGADDRVIGIEDKKKLLSGDVSEVRALINLRPNNKIKLLYGVKRSENPDTGKVIFRQTVCTGYDLMARNSAPASVLAKLEKDLASAKSSGMYQNTDFAVQELQEWIVEPTNLEQAPASADSGSSSELPWEA